ncbi:hypothetical protein J6590_034384 [Homalodisca vitripennis]|nr:hypothetical protein J6590_034384 [Homalodisca vitripennis]
MSESDVHQTPEKTRKRKSQPETYKRNVIKSLKLEGKEYKGHGGKLHRHRSSRSPCRCQKKCFNKFDDVDRAVIHDSLYSNLHSKDEQDLHLQRMIDVKGFKYHVLLRDLKVEVCREAFFRLYDVTDKSIKRLRKLLLIGEYLVTNVENTHV